MSFNYVLGIQELDKEKININHRVAIRAIIFKENNILMVHNNKGDYKFPGGGTNKGESHADTLEREVREETGYIVKNIKEKIGEIIERNLDEYKENTVFEMISYYYLCEIFDNKTEQQLDDYEAELDFQPAWISLDKAIKLNGEILKRDKQERNAWVERETDALKALKRIKML